MTITKKKGGPTPTNTQNNKPRSKRRWKRGRKAESASLVEKGVEEKLSTMANKKNVEENNMNC